MQQQAYFNIIVMADDNMPDDEKGLPDIGNDGNGDGDKK